MPSRSERQPTVRSEVDSDPSHARVRAAGVEWLSVNRVAATTMVRLDSGASVRTNAEVGVEPRHGWASSLGVVVRRPPHIRGLADGNEFQSLELEIYLALYRSSMDETSVDGRFKNLYL